MKYSLILLIIAAVSFLTWLIEVALGPYVEMHLDAVYLLYF